VDWYLVIPWILGIGASLLARQRQVKRPVWLGIGFFVVGCGIVLVFDLVTG
jgi:hypothetical protein